jgi:hypothetical protein
MTGIGFELLTALVSAHLIADFLLQNNAVVANKHRWWVLAFHVLGAGAAAYLACGLWRLWWIFAGTAGTHWILDRLKLGSRRPHRPTSFLVDQAAHLSVAVLLAILAASSAESRSVWPGIGEASRALVLKGLVLTAGLLLAGKVGGILIGLWVHPLLLRMRRETRRIARSAAERVAPPQARIGSGSEAPRGLANAGRIIGQLERLLIFLMVFSGDTAGVGFLVAAKSIFRFGELKDPSNRMEAEYILIGTLVSFVYGLFVAHGTLWVWRRF